ncbi:hypothetical protein BDF22DRAFT_623418 [Syncephalis plumigaleata]|nr:hypothetical protein BDF22DRAFT_623418 [Syncephalis plumigaleata]
MSINQVALSTDGNAPVLLPNEKVFFEKSSVRLELTYGNGYPGSSGCYTAASGHVYLSNQRIIYLPRPSLVGFHSLAMPLLNINQGKLTQPWFNANYYSCIVEPVYQGGLPAPSHVKLYFTEGGAFEFTTIYRQLRERMQGN